MAELPEVIAKLGDILGTKEDRPMRMPALLGNGSGTVEVDAVDRPGFVYVRASDGSPLGIAFNQAVPNRDNLPVVVGYTHENPNVFQVLSVRETYYGIAAFTEIINQLRRHHETHEHQNPDGGGDVVWVRQQQLMPMLCAPTDPASMQVEVRAALYNFAGTWQYFTDTTSADLTSRLPSSGNKRYVLISIDGAANELVYTNGTEYDEQQAVAYEDGIPDVPGGAYPCGAVLLFNDTTSIDWDTNLTVDPRYFVQNAAMEAVKAMGPLEHELDHWVSYLVYEYIPQMVTRQVGFLEAEIDYDLSNHFMRGLGT